MNYKVEYKVENEILYAELWADTNPHHPNLFLRWSLKAKKKITPFWRKVNKKDMIKASKWIIDFIEMLKEAEELNQGEK